MFKTITKKVLFIQTVAILLLMGLLTMYLNRYLHNYFVKEAKANIKSGLHSLNITVDVYSKALEKNALKLYNVFEGSFKQVALIEDEYVNVNGVKTPMMADGGEVLNKYFKSVDHFTKVTGATATVFAYDKNKNDFVRISTSLRKEDGTRAMGTYLTKKSPAFKPIMAKKEYVGTAHLFGKDYITVYKPLLDDNKNIIGILYIGYNFSEGLRALKKDISKIKIGKTGYYYVINTKQNKYIIHPRLENKTVMSAIDKLIEKKKRGTISKENGSEHLLYDFFYFKKWNWVVVGKANMKDFKAVGNRVSNLLLLATLAVTIIIILVIFFMLNRLITKPLNNLTQKAADLASGDGDLTKKLEIHGEDEIAQASKEINSFIEKVRLITQEAKHISSENSSIANELSSTALEVGKLVESSTKATHEANTKTKEIKDKLVVSVQEAKEARIELEKVDTQMKEANQAILQLAEDIQTSASTEIELAGKIQQLSSDAEQVKGVLTVISDIADQTNLLALNAAIEAARAGEHGRGFAVVADEVRKLAERTQKSLVEINATINVIVQSIVQSSEEMNANSQQVEVLSHKAVEVEEKIDEMAVIIDNAATKTSDATEKGYSETQRDVDIVVEQVSKIDSISTKNARSTEEIASAAEHLNEMTEALKNKLNEFRT
ncbi:MAG: methyl-accepting chemotaxis protein [Sulfurospirillum sp.]